MEKGTEKGFCDASDPIQMQEKVNRQQNAEAQAKQFMNSQARKTILKLNWEDDDEKKIQGKIEPGSVTQQACQHDKLQSVRVTDRSYTMIAMEGLRAACDCLSGRRLTVHQWL